METFCTEHSIWSIELVGINGFGYFHEFLDCASNVGRKIPYKEPALPAPRYYLFPLPAQDVCQQSALLVRSGFGSWSPFTDLLDGTERETIRIDVETFWMLAHGIASRFRNLSGLRLQIQPGDPL